jgi:glycine/serine hydroxymethyltransferase
MREPEMREIGGFLHRVLSNPGDIEEFARIRSDVEALCRRFPLYTSRWSERD